MKAKRRINKFDFQAEGSHVALVPAGANEQEVLLMKSVHTVEGQTPFYEISEHEINTQTDGDVRITLSMQLFLEKFFNMYSYDAANLSRVLGYDGRKDWYESEYGKDYSVELLKAHFESNKITDEVYEILKALDDNHSEAITEHFKEKDAMKDKEALQKAIDEAVTKALADKEKEFKDSIAAKDEELAKAKETVEELAKAAEAKAKEDITELVKGYSFIEDSDSFIETIFKMRKVEGFDVIVDTLEKAQKAIDAAVTVTDGIDGDVVDVDKSLTEVSDIIKARKAKRNGGK